MDSDALDNQLQEGLPVGSAGTLQSYADTLAERCQAFQHVLGMNLLFVQAAVLFKLLLSQATLLHQTLTALGQLAQADDLGLVGFQEAAVGAAQSVQARLQLLAGRLFPGLRHVGLGDEPFELRQQLGRTAEQAGNVVPHHLLQRVSTDPGPRASRLAAGREGIRAGTLVVAVA